MNWSHRIVRKETPYGYSYGVYEVFLDDEGRAFACTEEPVVIGGENIQQARSSWLSMLEAFGQPILDYDKIPESGAHNELDERIRDIEEHPENLIPHDEVMKSLREEFGIENDFCLETYERKLEEERVAFDDDHAKNFLKLSFEELFNKILEEYRRMEKK